MSQALILLGNLLLLAGATLRHLDWSVERSVVIVAERTLIAQTINGQVHTPPVHVENEDWLSINVTNNLPDIGVTFHWHGFVMKGAQLYDGVAGLTQCLIAPGESYNYVWKVEENPGTYWFHTHSGLPIIAHDFARGALIVHPKGSGKADLVDYEEETNERILFYEDIYPNWPFMDYLLSNGGLGPHPLLDLEGFSESFILFSGGVINGQGNAIINVKAGQTYTFRLLNGGHVFAYIWSIDGLSFKVVGSDGAACQPYQTDALQIHVGERFDVEVEIPPYEKNKSVFMRALTPAYILIHGIYAHLNIQGTKSTSEVYPSPSMTYTSPRQVLNCVLHPDYQHLQNCQPITNLQPTAGLHMPHISEDNVDIHIIDFDDERTPYAGHWVSIDNGVFKQVVLPGKAMIKSDFIDSYEQHPNFQALRLELNKTVVLVFRSATAFPHPIHVHGHKYEILEVVARKEVRCPHARCEWQSLVTAFSIPLIELARQSKRSVLKDVAIIPAGGLVAIRFVTDNPGVWAIHCHLEQHMEDGQILAMDEGHYRTSTFPKDYPSCEYTGRIAVRERSACVCMEQLNVYRPQQAPTHYLCSEPHLCRMNDELEEEEKLQEYELQEYEHPRFRPEQELSWHRVRECIERGLDTYYNITSDWDPQRGWH